jgi:hypothetical protein
VCVRDEDGGSGSLSLFDSLCYALEDGQSKMLSASLLGVCASDDLGACPHVNLLHHSLKFANWLGAYRIRWLVLRENCAYISTLPIADMFCLHSRSLLASEALEQHLGVAVDAEVLDRLGILRGASRILPGRGLGERRAQRLSDRLHRDCAVVTKANLEYEKGIAGRFVGV